jgi:hypothetical protein
MSAQTTE